MALRCGLMLGRAFVANITTLNHAPMASWHTWCQPQPLVTLGHTWCQLWPRSRSGTAGASSGHVQGQARLVPAQATFRVGHGWCQLRPRSGSGTAGKKKARTLPGLSAFDLTATPIAKASTA